MTLPISHPELRRLLEHQGFVQRLARTLCLDESSAQDLEQETWLTALRNPPTDDSAPKAWLRTVMRNLHFRRHRDAGNRAFKESRGTAESTRRVSAPDEEVAADQARERMGEALARLPEQYRFAVVLRFEEGLPPRAIGERLGIDSEQARWRVRRGVEILRSDLDRDTDRRDWMSGLLLLTGSDGNAIPRNATRPGLAVVAATGVALLAVLAAAQVSKPADLPAMTAGDPLEITLEESLIVGTRSEASTTPISPQKPGPETGPQGKPAILGLALRRGTPVEGARVLLRKPGQRRGHLVGKTDKDGRFVVTSAPRGSWVGVAGAKYQSSRVWLEGPALGASLEFVMEHELHSLSGRVFDSAGDPVEGVMVRVDETHSLAAASFRADGLRWDLPRSQASTDERGRFTLRTPLQYPPVRISNDGQGWAGRIADGNDIHLAAGLEWEEASGSGNEEVTVRGRVCVGEALLLFQGESGEVRILPTDEEGNFYSTVPAVPGVLSRWYAGAPPLPLVSTDGTGMVVFDEESRPELGQVSIVVDGAAEKGRFSYELRSHHSTSPLTLEFDYRYKQRDSAYFLANNHLVVRNLMPGFWDVVVRANRSEVARETVQVQAGELTRLRLTWEGVSEGE